MPTGRSEKIKLYLVIVLAVAAVILAYFRFIHKKNDVVVSTTGPPSEEVKFDIQQIVKPKARRRQAPRLPLHDSLSGDIRDIFAPVKPAIEPKPPIQTKQAPAPVDTAKQAPAPIAKQTPAPAVTLELKGTITGGKNSMAIINDKFVRPGEKVGDYEVIRITPNTVYLKAGSHQKVIEVLTPAEK
jgi:hypothetical protein